MILSGLISSFDQNFLCFVLRKILCETSGVKVSLAKQEKGEFDDGRRGMTYLENVIVERQTLVFELGLEIRAVKGHLVR